ncbi:monovalent cation/H(+) antiporter subunit G [Roseomonas sp. F4]
MSAVREILAALLLVGGAGVVALAALGVARLPDPFSRMHAAAKAGVVGAGLLLLGAGLAFGTTAALLTSLGAMLFLLLTAPLASHALGRAAYVAGAPLGPDSVADALAGVLDRHVFDIDPGRAARPRPPRPPLGSHDAMSTVPEFRRPARTADLPGPVAEATTIRRVLCCLLGGPAQGEATAAALDVARAAGAQLTGLSGAGLEPRSWQGPLPVGGVFWADWLAARSRAQIRQNCAAALDEFQRLAAAAPDLDVVARHEETEAGALSRLLAGHDLAVLPAGIGPHGTESELGMEIAASLARARVVPVLRVRQRPERVRGVVLVVGHSARCGGLAAGLLRSGLWPQAAIAILPVADDRAGVAAMVAAQADLLRAHGRRVSVRRSVDLDFEVDELRQTLAHFDLAVMSCLSTRHGGFFDSLRGCAFETAAETVPLTLLP